MGAHNAKRRRGGWIDTKARLSVSGERIRKHRVVEQVGDDILELQADALRDMNVFHQPHIHVPVRETTEHANAAGIGVEPKIAGRSVLSKPAGSPKMLNAPGPALLWSDALPEAMPFVKMQFSVVKKLELSACAEALAG